MTAKQAELAARYGVEPIYTPDETYPPPELFPKRLAWVVREEDGKRALDAMTWGFPPPAAGRAVVTNVRNLSSPFWRLALNNPARRCLVPFTDFCEWEGEKGSKLAWWFSDHSRPIVSFAGVWRPTEEGRAMAFLTCDPNPVVAPIHPKAMPVMLHEEDEEAWLRGKFDAACALAQPYPSQLMRMV